MKWQSRKKTTPHKGTPHAPQSPRSNANIDDADVVQAKLQIGATLQLLSFIGQYALSLRQVAQSNLATPKTVEALSYALWEMANLTMNILDRLRTFQLTYSPSLLTSPSHEELANFIDLAHEFLIDIIVEYDL